MLIEFTFDVNPLKTAKAQVTPVQTIPPKSNAFHYACFKKVVVCSLSVIGAEK